MYIHICQHGSLKSNFETWFGFIVIFPPSQKINELGNVRSPRWRGLYHCHGSGIALVAYKKRYNCEKW